MSTTVKSLKVSYSPVNASNTFTHGDCLSGRVALEVVKTCHIESLSVTFKGKAEVLWTERHGRTTSTYHSKNKYFSLKHYFIRDRDVGGEDNETLLTNHHGDTYSSNVAPGCHVYPFTFQISSNDFPPSFTGSVGKIVYSLEAKLSRSMRITKKDLTRITFVPKVDLNNVPALMTPQHESKDKKMKLFNSGTVAMDVHIEKTGYFQGEGLKVLAHIQNNSSRAIKPKYCVYTKHSFFANGKRKLITVDLFKVSGEPILPSANQNVTQVLGIPPDLEPSILNCDIIKVEYRLRVYLDVKYAFDPEIKFPIIILRAPQVSAEAPPSAAAAAPVGFGFEPFGTPNPPALGIVPPRPPVETQSFDPPPPYAAHAMYPPLSDFGNKYQ